MDSTFQEHFDYVDIGKYFGGSTSLVVTASIICFIKKNVTRKNVSLSCASSILARQLALNGLSHLRLLVPCPEDPHPDVTIEEINVFIDAFKDASSGVQSLCLSRGNPNDVKLLSKHASTCPLIISVQSTSHVKQAIQAGITIAILSERSFLIGERLYCFTMPADPRYLTMYDDKNLDGPLPLEEVEIRKLEGHRQSISACLENTSSMEELETSLKKISSTSSHNGKIYQQVTDDLDPNIEKEDQISALTTFSHRFTPEQQERRREQRIMTRISTYASSLHGASSCFNQVLRSDDPVTKGSEKKKPSHAKSGIKKSLSKAELMKQENTRRLMEADLVRQQKILAVARESCSTSRTIDSKLAILDQLRIDRETSSPAIYVSMLLEKLRIFGDAWRSNVLNRSSDLATSTKDADFVHAIALFEVLFEIIDSGCEQETSLLAALTPSQLEAVILPSFALFGFLDAGSKFIIEWASKTFSKKDVIKAMESALVRASREVGKYKVRHSYVRFQLLFCGHLALRSDAANEGPVVDPRVRFRPDPWQVELLDAVDEGHSALISAPTSSGKTFICYYAMERVLRRSDTGVVLYVAPNKALMDQVVADVYARFKHKQYPKNSASRLLGYLTDLEVFHAWDAQILVTFPEVIERFITSPLYEESFFNRVEYVILDEIHTISEEGKSGSWEKILMTSRAPVLALSATVGNKEAFFKWLSTIQERAGIQCRLIDHAERYSDLQYHIFSGSVGPTERQNLLKKEIAQTKESNDENQDHDAVESQNLASTSSLLSVRRRMGGDGRILLWHQLLSLSMDDFDRQLPPDFYLLSGDSVRLADVFKTGKFRAQLPAELDYEKMPCFTERLRIRRSDLRAYSRNLMNWIRGCIYERTITKTDFLQIQKALGNDALSALHQQALHETEDLPSQVNDGASFPITYENYLMGSVMPLLTELSVEDRLPAIIFHFDRSFCNRLAVHIIESLEHAEAVKHSRHLREERLRMSALERSQRASRRVRDAEKKTSKDSWIEESMEAESISDLMAALMRTQGPDPEFVFYDQRWKISDIELGELIDAQGVARAMTSPVEKVLFRGLYRGIGVHHRGVPKRYLSLVEHLFRLRHLQVVIAGATLALGINMPCKSVIFAGSTSTSLTPIDFRQASGRAGRRNYDALGHVIFWGMPKNRLDNLQTSTIPSIRTDAASSLNAAMVLQAFHMASKGKEGISKQLFLERFLSSPLSLLGLTSGEQASHGKATEKSITPVLASHFFRLACALERLGFLTSINEGKLMAPTVYARLPLLLPSQMPASIIVSHLMRLGWIDLLSNDYERAPDATVKELLLFLCRFVQLRYLPAASFNVPAELVVLPPLHSPEMESTLQSDLIAYCDTLMGDSKIATRPDSFHRGALILGKTIIGSSVDRDTASASVNLPSMLMLAMPFHTIPPDVFISGYVWDYFLHADVERIHSLYHISEMALWYELNEFSNFLAQLHQMAQREPVASEAAKLAISDLYLTFFRRFRLMWA